MSVVRRAALGLLVALGVLLMHAGVCSAQACSSMPGMTGIGDMPATSMPTSTALVSAGHHDPGHPGAPVLAHGGMCTGTPVSAAGAHDVVLTASLAVVAVASRTVTPRASSGVVGTGREPPTPDPVTVLGVDRR